MSTLTAGKTITDSLYAYRFVRLMSKSFSEWKAFDLGLIDERGNLIRRPKSEEEKSSYTPFHAAVRSFKRTLGTVPGLTGISSAMAGWSAISSRFDLTESDIDYIKKELPLMEEVVAGDSGGSVENIVTGVTTGAVVSAGPTSTKKRKIVNLKK